MCLLSFLKCCTVMHFAISELVLIYFVTHFHFVAALLVFGQCWLEHPTSTSWVNWLFLDVKHVNSLMRFVDEFLWCLGCYWHLHGDHWNAHERCYSFFKHHSHCLKPHRLMTAVSMLICLVYLYIYMYGNI